MLSNRVLASLDALQTRVMRHPAAARLTMLCRVLLAVAFIPTGTVKLLGERFTLLGVDTPVGYFFEAMYQTGGYWRFLGLSQVIAGCLLLWPVTAFYGALLFLPILVNVVVVTIAIEFKGTPIITVLMLLANLWLLAWDWPRWRALVTRVEVGSPIAGSSVLERTGWTLGTLAMVAFFFAARGVKLVGLSLAPVQRSLVGIGLSAGVMVLVAWIRDGRAARGRGTAGRN